MNGLLFNAKKFVIGGVYQITSDYETYDHAILHDACEGSLEFLIPIDEQKSTYKPIQLTPKLVGAQHYDFTLQEDMPVYMFAGQTICGDVFQYHDHVVTGNKIWHDNDGLYHICCQVDTSKEVK